VTPSSIQEVAVFTEPEGFDEINPLAGYEPVSSQVHGVHPAEPGITSRRSGTAWVFRHHQVAFGNTGLTAAARTVHPGNSACIPVSRILSTEGRVFVSTWPARLE
jgi:hypothetical protein